MKLLDLNISKQESDALKSNKIRQVVGFLNDHYSIRVNKFKPGDKEISSKSKRYDFPISLDDISLHLHENEIMVSDSILRKIINSPNQIRAYNPIREYFESLEGKYQGVSHIDLLCKYMVAKQYNDQEEGFYQERMLRLMKKWFVAAVACGLEEFQNEVALGLIQEEEGTGKTSVCQKICPEPLKMMFVTSDKEKNGFNVRNSFTENFMVLFDEFIGLSSFTAETFKSAMSASQIDVKERHDPFPRRKSRIANAMFTTNNKTGRNKGFIIPSLGTRRFLCIHLDGIDYDSIMKDLNVDQLWAEAFMLFNNKFNYKWGPADFKEFADYNVRFMVETSAVQILESNFARPINGSDGSWMQPQDILKMIKDNHLANRETLNELSPEKLGMALKQLGYVKKGMRIKGEVKYPYHVKSLL